MFQTTDEFVRRYYQLLFFPRLSSDSAELSLLATSVSITCIIEEYISCFPLLLQSIFKQSLCLPLALIPACQLFCVLSTVRKKLGQRRRKKSGYAKRPFLMETLSQFRGGHFFEEIPFSQHRRQNRLRSKRSLNIYCLVHKESTASLFCTSLKTLVHLRSCTRHWEEVQKNGNREKEWKTVGPWLLFSALQKTISGRLSYVISFIKADNNFRLEEAAFWKGPESFWQNDAQESKFRSDSDVNYKEISFSWSYATQDRVRSNLTISTSL